MNTIHYCNVNTIRISIITAYIGTLSVTINTNCITVSTLCFQRCNGVHKLSDKIRLL